MSFVITYINRVFQLMYVNKSNEICPIDRNENYVLLPTLSAT